MSRPDQPTLLDAFRDWIEAYRQDDHHNMVARVHAVRGDGTLDLEAVVKHAVEQPDGSTTYEDLPILPSVPWGVPRSGDWFVSLPVAVGDPVLVLLFDASHEHWRAGDGAPQYPGDLRRFTHGSCVAVPANYYPRARSLAHASATDLVLGDDGDDGTRLTIKPDGTLTITRGDTVVLQVDPDRTVHIGGNAGTNLVALANLVNTRIGAIVSWLNAHTHPVSGPVAGVSTPALAAQASVAATKTKAL